MIFRTGERTQRSHLNISFVCNETGESIIPTQAVGWKIQGNKRDNIERITCDILGAVTVDTLEPKEDLLFLF